MWCILWIDRGGSDAMTWKNLQGASGIRSLSTKFGLFF